MRRRQPTPDREERLAQRHARMAAAATVRPLRAGTYTGSTTAAAPKTKPYRDPVLLEMACGRSCLLCPPAQCACVPGTVVACHSNWHALGGKAKNRRADDCYTVWGGREAHARLDQPVGHGGPTKSEKMAIFMAAHLRQVLAWREIAADSAEPERFRRAAQRALEHLNATPLGELP